MAGFVYGNEMSLFVACGKQLRRPAGKDELPVTIKSVQVKH